MKRMQWLWGLTAVVIFFFLGLGLAVGRLLWDDVRSVQVAAFQESPGFFFLRGGLFGGMLLLLLLLEIYYYVRYRSQRENRR